MTAQSAYSRLSDALVSSAISDDVVFAHFIQRGIETPITYGTLRREASRYAAYFQKSGVHAGDVVVIILSHSPNLFYSFLGATLMGAVPSFMPTCTVKQDPARYWESHRQLFQRLSGNTLLTSRQNAEQIRQFLPDQPLPILTTEDAVAVAPESIPASVSPNTIALLQHSSGTTGLKKGVALSHKKILIQIEQYAASLQLTRDDCIVSWLPLYHDMGLIACFLLPLIKHIPLVLLDPIEWVTSPASLFAAIKKHRGTLCWQPNFAFNHLCRTVRSSPTIDLSSMRAWINCSEPCKAESFQLFAKTFHTVGVKPEQLQVCYAMAETVFAVTQTELFSTAICLNLDPDALRRGCAVELPDDQPGQPMLTTGAPLPGMDIRICDQHYKPLPEGEVGEICLTSDFLFDGYYKLESETRRKLIDGWYHTGDMGFLHRSRLYVTGRKNDLIIVHGKNFYAHELEYIVNQIPGVHPGRNVAIGWFRPEVGSEEVVIVAEADDTALASKIKQALLDQTGLLVFDVHIVASGWLIKTTSGKISRTENLTKYLDSKNKA